MPAGPKSARSYVIRGIIYVVVGVVFTFAEYAWHLWSEKPCDPPDAGTESALTTRSFYTYLTTLDWRKPENRITVVITIRADREPKEVFDAFCAHREMLAHLIKEVSVRRPISIVVDNYLSDEPCPVDAQIKQTLQDAGVPVILGLHTLNKSQLQHFLGRPLTDQELKSFERACLVVHDNKNLGLPEGTPLHYGLIRFNADTRKLPLAWNVFTDPGHIGPQDRADPEPTLAAVAAATVPNVKVPALEAHPYTSFLRDYEISAIPAMEVLCAQYRPGTDWRNCEKSGKALDARLEHRVVLIGDDVDADQHDTPVGSMAGVLLHANYIESLVGERYFRPIGEVWQIVGGILLLVLIEFIYVESGSPLAGLAFSIGATAVVWFLCALVSIMTGILPVIWVPGAVALFLRFGEAIRERVMGEHAKE